MNPTATRFAPWLAVTDGAASRAFYKEALGALEVERLEDGNRVAVAQLTVDGATFWIQEDPAQSSRAAGAVRLILTVDDPDAWFGRALGAGAQEIAGMHEAHGWRTGRVSDPFGHDWEVSKPLPK